MRAVISTIELVVAVAVATALETLELAEGVIVEESFVRVELESVEASVAVVFADKLVVEAAELLVELDSVEATELVDDGLESEELSEEAALEEEPELLSFVSEAVSTTAAAAAPSKYMRSSNEYIIHSNA